MSESIRSLVITAMSASPSLAPAPVSPVDILTRALLRPRDIPPIFLNSASFSDARALRGLRYTILPGRRADRWAIIERVATSVLPLAVGAETRTLRPPSSPALTAAACGGYSSS